MIVTKFPQKLFVRVYEIDYLCSGFINHKQALSNIIIGIKMVLGSQRIFLILSLWCSPFLSTICGQTPQDGDNFRLRMMSVANVNDTGDDFIWDFSHSSIAEEEIPVLYKESNDSTFNLLKVLPNSICHYTMKGDTLLMSGYEDKKNSMTFLYPVEEYIHSFNYGDSLVGYTYGNGRYCEEFPYRLYGQYVLKNDGCGTLILPEGDTLYHVRRYKQDFVKTYESISNFEELDSTVLQLSVIPTYLTITDNCVKETAYRWYVDDWPYPVLEAYSNDVYEGGKPVSHSNQAFCAVDVIKELKEEKVGKPAFKNMVSLRNAQSIDRDNNTPLSYKLFPENNGLVKVKYNLEEEMQISFGFYTVDGILVYDSGRIDCVCGPHETNVMIPSDKRGTLIFHILFGDKEMTEKIIIK